MFVSERDENPEVYTVPANGGDAIRRTTDPGGDFVAPPPPTGEVLLIRTLDDERGHQEQMWLMPLTGEPTSARALGPRTGKVRNPSWSPDGAWVVFESDEHSFRDLYRVDVATGELRRLTDNRQGNFEPAVSPDGSRIAFASSRDGNAEIYVMGADGANPRRVTNSPGDDTAPAWAPDGSELAWVSVRTRSSQIHGIAGAALATGGDADLRNVITQKTRVDGDVQAFLWSPAGDTIAVSEVGQGRVVLLLVDARTGAERGRVAHPGHAAQQPAWSPDGRQLVFSSNHEGDDELYRVGADGKGLTRLTNQPGPDWLPRWLAAPDCTKAG